MPKRDDINSVLVLGAGPIVIGQACEFDYSGTQACRALRQEGIRVALLNSNPATIMTDPETADATYIEPVNADTAEKIIAKEKPDAVLPTMGGQTALNCAMELHRRGVFDGKTRLIGASAASIYAAEDRQAFKQAMEDIGLQCAPSVIADNLRDALVTAKEIGFPIIVRPSFTLGGSGGGIAYNNQEFKILAAQGLSESPTGAILLEKSLIGWKEFEMEAVRDSADNCIIICSIENIDPMGVHTGDSITVAPAQTLTDKEYQKMRDASIAVLRKIGVDTGGANVQFAVNPQNGELAVIEMNPRVSRSSALASKATGFPIAKVAAKLAIGYTLDELQNDIAVGAPASFEPAIDYIVVKIPRFDFAKFAPTTDQLTTQMRSVGEVMAIGSTFAESLQKAARALEIGVCGLQPPPDVASSATADADSGALRKQLTTPNSMRLFAIFAALCGTESVSPLSVEEVCQLTNIDPWFVREIQEIAMMANDIKQYQLSVVDEKMMRLWKKTGFADERIGQLLGESAAAVCRQREQLGVHPVFRRIDTCAGEFPTATAYLYSTYFYDAAAAAAACELRPTDKRKIIILGSGPNRIGQGIEFDYCCIHGVMALGDAGYETIMINCNPETVSTDYDTADRLFFEPLTAEDVWEICRREKPHGVIVQFGGQTPLSIARDLQNRGAPIIGTSVDAIDRAESRESFKALIESCGLRQPMNAAINFARHKTAATAVLQAVEVADSIGYPLVARPGYVLGGKAMQIVHSREELQNYFIKFPPSPRGDILLDKFLENAIEVDVDAVRDGDGDCLIAGIMQHIEKAGIHSGDSACCLPPYSLSPSIIAALREQTRMLAEALQVCGMMNIQFAICDGEIFILEVNPRASRTAPFVSKAMGLPIAKIAAQAMAGVSLSAQGVSAPPPPPFFAVKEAVFPFNKFPDVDVLLGPEMKSTGETMGIAEDFPRAFMLAQEAILPIPKTGTVFISVADSEKSEALAVARRFHQLGFHLIATRGSADYLNANDIPAAAINKVKEGRPHIVDAIVGGDVQVVINTESPDADSRRDSFSIRRAALVNRVVYYTTVAGADAATRGLEGARDGFVPQTLQQWQRRRKNT